MKIEEKEIIDNIGQIGLFICSSGFEERSTKLALTLDSRNISHSIIIHLNDTYRASISNLDIIKQKIENSEVVEYPKNNSLETFDIFYSALKKFNEEKEDQQIKVVIDVSTFTREILLILIKVITIERFSNFDKCIVYTPNESYSNDESNFWMTKGIREIRSIIGFSGLHSPSKKLLLLILNGFEEERTENIIECFEPAKLIIGKPDKMGSINSNLNKIACSKFENVKLKYQNLIAQEFEFSCTDIEVTITALNKIIAENEDYNIVISPLNNKISTIGAAIVALKNDDIQICYASANQYNIDSKGITSNYFLVYNLNPLLE
jgi:hypothetical protein